MTDSQQLTLFAADFPAKIFQSPGSERESMVSAVTYGKNCADLLAVYDRATRSWRTLQTSLLENEDSGLAQFSETWPRSGMMRNGIAYRLPPLVPRTSVTGFGLLPTPLATRTTKSSPGYGPVLLEKLVPQPTTSNVEEAQRQRYLGSPSYRRNLSEHLRASADCPIYPHPEFVEALMGYPIGHTDLER